MVGLRFDPEVKSGGIFGHVFVNSLLEVGHSARVRVLTKNSTDTYAVRSNDVRCRPLHVEITESHFQWVFVTKVVEVHVFLLHKKMKFVLLPAIRGPLQKTGSGSIDWAKDLVVKVRAFGKRRFAGSLVTGKDLCFFIGSKDRGEGFSQHSIDLGLGNLGVDYNGDEYTDGD